MKKLLCMLLVAVLMLGCLAGCGGDKGNSSEAPADSPKIKVGAIYINGKDDTAGYTFAHSNGINAALKALNIPEDNLFVVDNVPEDMTAVTQAIDTLVNDGCNIIFGISFGYLEAMDAAAKKYPDIIFSHATGYLSNATNFNNYFGRIYQARYLSGIAAGLKSLEMKNNNVGYVSAWGTEYAETCSGINAFALGVQAVNPDAKVYVNKISTWGDENKEKQAAQNLIDTYKCGVISQHCDSAQPQLVAADNKIFGCGYNSDMSVQAPTAHLTAPVWNWNVYYEFAIKTAMEEPAKFMEKVGNYYGGLKEGFVDISPITKNCTANTEAIVAAVKKMMVDGEWDVFTNVKLSIASDGTITKNTAAQKDNKGNVVISEDGKTFFVYDKDGKLASKDAFGNDYAHDGVITGSMNYYVEGVVAQ